MSACHHRNPSTLGASSTAFITSLTGPMPGSYNLIEVTCQHDANVQKSDLKGTVGSPTRPGIQPTVCPFSLARTDCSAGSVLHVAQSVQLPCRLALSLRSSDGTHGVASRWAASSQRTCHPS